MDPRLLKDARENLDGANSIIAGIRAEGGHRFYDEVRARTGMDGKELDEYVKGAAATFRRVAIESSVAVFLFKYCSMYDRTFETFRDLVQETIQMLKVTKIPERPINPELARRVEEALAKAGTDVRPIVEEERKGELPPEPLVYRTPAKEK